VCAASMAALEHWADRVTGGTPQLCRTCRA
jgi:hypothetical protein